MKALGRTEKADFHADGYSDDIVAFLSSSLLSFCSSDVSDCLPRSFAPAEFLCLKPSLCPLFNKNAVSATITALRYLFCQRVILGNQHNSILSFSMSLICSVKHFGWRIQANTKPKSIYAVFRRCRSRWFSGRTPDCGARGPRFESHRGRSCLSRQSLRYTVQPWARVVHPYCSA